MIKKICQLLAFLLLLPIVLIAQVPEKPNPQRLVNDFSQILSSEEVNQLEQKLVAFNDSTSNQIVIVIIDDLGGMDKAQYATELGHKWGVGQKDKDNGIVILVKPSGGQGERGAFISVGYGLEGAIPDLAAKQIVDNEMIPNFKSNNFYKGLDDATTVLMKLAAGEITAANYKKKKSFSPMLIGIVLFIIIMIISSFTKARSYAHNNDTSFWAALFLMSSMRSSGGSWNDFNSGSGGFGGFGGGDFGGGGAGGDW
ncbi:MAG: TPM domain-containing protein [Bacteroidota bacterium]